MTHGARRRHSLSIKSLLLLMLLLVSVGSNVGGGVIGYINGTESLSKAAEARLTEVRDSRAREVVNLFDSIEAALLLASRDSAVVDAELAFSGAVAELEDAAIANDAVTAAGGASAAVLTDEQKAELVAYFTDDVGIRSLPAVSLHREGRRRRLSGRRRGRRQQVVDGARRAPRLPPPTSATGPPATPTSRSRSSRRCRATASTRGHLRRLRGVRTGARCADGPGGRSDRER